MSALSPHVKAFSTLAKAYDDRSAYHAKLASQAIECGSPELSSAHETLARACHAEATVYRAAAEDLDQQVRREYEG